MGKSAFDIGKIAVYIIAAGGVVTIGALNTILQPWGVSPAEISVISARIGSVVALAVLIVMMLNAIKNPSPPNGTTSALIPTGSVPVVAAAPGTGALSVAVASPETALEITPATQAPPPQNPTLAASVPQKVSS